MKKWILLFAATALVLRADDTPPPAAPPPVTDDETALHEGYPSQRYQDLWTKSPFAVETPEQGGATESADYLLVGVAQVEGVTYVSLVNTHNQNHLLVSSDKPLGGLKLNTIDKKSDGTYATLTENGESITLKLQTAAAGGGQPMAGGNMPEPNAPGQTPGYVPQNIAMPGSNRSNRPFVRLHRPTILVPPRTGGTPPVPGNNPNPQAPGQPAPPPPANPQ